MANHKVKKINRLKKVTRKKIEVLKKEQEKTLDKLIDAGSKERIERDLDLFVDKILKYQPKKED